MKSLFIFMTLFIPTLLFAQTDSVFQLTKSETITLANKIRGLQDSLRFKDNIISTQSSYIRLADGRIVLCDEQLKNREQLLGLMHEKNVELAKQVDALRPKWYTDNKVWFVAGIATAVFVYMGVK